MAKRNGQRWQALEARLGREMTIWMATEKRDGRPHLVPVWFIWLEGKLYIATGTGTQKYTNLRYNQKISLSLPDTENVLIIEGEAHAATRQTADRLAEYFFNKYEWDFQHDESADWRLIEITPQKILAWGDGFDADGARIL